MTTGKRIKNARRQAGLTQAELADRLGVPFQSISQWERDIRNPKKETIVRIAKALNISVSCLLDSEDLEIYDSAISEGQDAVYWVQHHLDGYSHSKPELLLSRAFSYLNDDGQQQASKRVEELTQIPKYTKCFDCLTPEQKHLVETGQWQKLIDLNSGSAETSVPKEGDSGAIDPQEN